MNKNIVLILAIFLNSFCNISIQANPLLKCAMATASIVGANKGMETCLWLTRKNINREESLLIKRTSYPYYMAHLIMITPLVASTLVGYKFGTNQKIAQLASTKLSAAATLSQLAACSIVSGITSYAEYYVLLSGIEKFCKN